jgi:hypothetical protein
MLSSFRMVARKVAQDRLFLPRRRIIYDNSVRRSGTKHIYRVCREDLCLGPLSCDTVMSRPRKSSVPRQRPFKVAESRLATVPVRRWLEPRAASTSLVFSFSSLGKARPGPPVHSKRKESGTLAQGDHDGFANPGSKVPSEARVPGVLQLGYEIQRTGRAKFSTS